MNTRRIQTATKMSDNWLTIENTPIVITSSASRLIYDMRIGAEIHFASRPFVGATRFLFVKSPNVDFYVSADGWRIHLCVGKVQEILNVGKRSRKFSLWIKNN